MIAKPTRSDFRDLEGLQFGRWKVGPYAGRASGETSLWLCKCACGKTKQVRASSLKSGASTSCGCFGLEQRMKVVQKFPPGVVQSPEYFAYHGAKSRCSNPKETGYKDYGGRGIGFRFSSFNEFLEDVGYRPSPKHSLDRKNVNGHYEPGNVRWATSKTQNGNTRRTLHITVRGQTHNLQDWARINRMPYGTYYARYRRLGWCAHCTVTLPTGEFCPHR